jgi:hypothetical protein
VPTATSQVIHQCFICEILSIITGVTSCHHHHVTNDNWYMEIPQVHLGNNRSSQLETKVSVKMVLSVFVRPNQNSSFTNLLPSYFALEVNVTQNKSLRWQEIYFLSLVLKIHSFYLWHIWYNGPFICSQFQNCQCWLHFVSSLSKYNQRVGRTIINGRMSKAGYQNKRI